MFKSETCLAFFHYLHGWVVPGDIVEAEIISEYEKNMRLSVELGSSLLLLRGDAMAEQQRHQQGEQHSSSQVILLQLRGLVGKKE